jgi:hypothetical protein
VVERAACRGADTVEVLCRHDCSQCRVSGGLGTARSRP